MLEFLGSKYQISETMLQAMKWIEIEKRFSVLRDWRNPLEDRILISGIDLALGAIEDCLQRSNKDPKSIGMVVHVTNSPGQKLPADLSSILAGMSGLSPSVMPLPIYGMGCAALVTAFQQINIYLQCNPGQQVLLAVSEVQTPYCQFPDTQRIRHYLEICADESVRSDAVELEMRHCGDIFNSILFGDGAVAFLLGSEGGSFSVGPEFEPITNIDPEDNYLVSADQGGSPIRHHPGGEGRIYLDARVATVGAKYAKLVAEGVLAKSGLSVDGIDRFLIHTGSAKIVRGVMRELGQGEQMDKARIPLDVLRNHGNMSAASIGMMIPQLINSGFSPGQIALVLAFGAGFHANGTLLRAL